MNNVERLTLCAVLAFCTQQAAGAQNSYDLGNGEGNPALRAPAGPSGFNAALLFDNMRAAETQALMSQLQADNFRQSIATQGAAIAQQTALRATQAANVNLTNTYANNLYNQTPESILYSQLMQSHVPGYGTNYVGENNTPLGFPPWFMGGVGSGTGTGAGNGLNGLSVSGGFLPNATQSNGTTLPLGNGSTFQSGNPAGSFQGSLISRQINSIPNNTPPFTSSSTTTTTPTSTTTTTTSSPGPFPSFRRRF